MTLKEIQDFIIFCKNNKVSSIKLSVGGDTLDLVLDGTFIDPLHESLKNMGNEALEETLFWSAGDSEGVDITPSIDNIPTR